MIVLSSDITCGPLKSRWSFCFARIARQVTALITFGFALGANAQTPPAAAQVKTDDKDQPVVLDAFVVTGYRRSLELSLDAKRNAPAMVDIISAEDVGKFPDTNLAESLSHIPGVTIDRLFGEGERVSILGTDPNLNRTLLNGEPIATADWYILDTPSRQFNYILLAPEVIGKAEVYRTWEPRLLEGSIGGTIIVHTVSPLNSRPLVATASASESYNDRSKKYEPTFSATVSWHNDAKTLGFLFGAQDAKDFIRRDGVEALGVLGNYTDATGTVIQNNFADPSYPQVGVVTQQGVGPNKGFIVDEVINAALFEQLRHRRGANATIEYKPVSKLLIELTGLYVNEKMNNTNTSLYPMYMVGGAPVTNPTFANGIMTSGSYTNATLEMDLFARKAQIKTQQYNAKFTLTDDAYELVGTAGYTRATGGTKMQAFRGTNLGAGSVTPFSIQVGPSSASWTITNPDASYRQDGNVVPDPVSGNSGFGGLVQEPERDTERWAQADFSVPISNDFFHKVLLGFRSSVHNQSETSNHQVALFGPGERKFLDLLRAAPSNYLSGLDGITPTMGTHPVGNFDAIFNQTANTPASATDIASGFWPGIQLGETLSHYMISHPHAALSVFLALPTDSAVVGPTFDAREVINAFYLELPFSSGKLSGNIGARFVETDTSGTSINVGRISGSPFPGALPAGQPLTPVSLQQFGAPGYQPQTPANIASWTQAQWDATEVPITAKVNNTQNNFLPALNLAYEAARDQIVRFAMAEVIARPNLLQEFGYTTLYPINTPGDVGGNGVGGTTGLNPYKSFNYDLSYEYYFAKNSYVAVNLFYKDIQNYIVNTTTPEIHANTTTFADQWFYVARPQNGGQATSKGVALSYQQSLSNGLGLQANYTRISAKGASGQLPFASKNQVNMGPYFENRLGLIRLTYSWRDDFATGSFNGSSTVWTRPYTEVDVNAAINLTKNISLTVAARNLLDETYRQYYSNPIAGGSQLFANAYKTGRVYSAGIQARF